MVWLRRLLGLALLATAAWLLSVLAAVAGKESALATAALLAALLMLLAWRSRRDGQAAWEQVIAVAAGGWQPIAIAVPSLHGLRRGPAMLRDRKPGFGVRSIWTQLRRMVGEGKMVLVDVTAAWCLTCKVNELAVLDRAPVLDRLRDPGVVAMRADWTRPDPAITAYLQSFGRYGVPLDVVYGPGSAGRASAARAADVGKRAATPFDHAGPPATGVAAR